LAALSRFGGPLGILAFVAVGTSLALVPVYAYRHWLYFEHVFSSTWTPESIQALIRIQTLVHAALSASIAAALGAFALGFYRGGATRHSGPTKPLALVFMVLGGLLLLPTIGLQVFYSILPGIVVEPELGRFFLRLQWATNVAASSAIPIFLLGLWLSTFGRHEATPSPPGFPLTPAVAMDQTQPDR
jgi:hypothetical protein